MTVRRISAARSPYPTGVKIGSVTFTPGAEAANAINVAIQLNDEYGAPLAVRGTVEAFLAETAAGEALVTTAPSGGVAAGANGGVLPIVAGKWVRLVSEANGLVNLVLTEATAKSFHLFVVLPDGTLSYQIVTFA